VLSVDNGSSVEAHHLQTLVRETFSHYLAPRVAWLASEIEQVLSESSIDRPTADAALAFSLVLPRSLPAPEVAPEADGEISFDWLGPSGKVFSVSVDGSGRLAYAGRFGPRSRVHGTEQLSIACPPEIIRGISKAVT
jgi:hypothetical protein